MDWYAILDGNEVDLEELSKSFKDQDLTIEKVGSEYILKSINFQSFSVSSEVSEKIKEKLENINAGLLVTFGTERPVQIQRVINVDEKGHRQGFIGKLLAFVVRVRPTMDLVVIRKDGDLETIVKSNPSDIIKALNSLAEKDQRAKDVVKLINHSFKSISTQSKIIEKIQADDFSPVNRGGKYYDDIKRLNKAANNEKYVGIKESRHADEKKTSPSNEPIMTIPEAKSLTLTIIHEWINEKHKNDTR